MKTPTRYGQLSMHQNPHAKCQRRVCSWWGTSNRLQIDPYLSGPSPRSRTTGRHIFAPPPLSDTDGESEPEEPDRVCFGCGEVESETVTLILCTKCRAVDYCSKQCQRDDWHLIHGMTGTFSTGWLVRSPRDDWHLLHGMTGTFSTGWLAPSPRDDWHLLHWMTGTFSTEWLAPSLQTPVCRTRKDHRGTSWHFLHKHQCAELAKIVEGHPGTFSTNTSVPNSPRSSRDILAPSPQTPVCRTRQDRRGTSWHLLHKHQCAELAKIVEGHPGTFSTNTSVPNSPRSSRDILAPSPQTPVCRTRQDHRGTSWHLLHKHLCAELAKIVEGHPGTFSTNTSVPNSPRSSRDILAPSPQTVCQCAELAKIVEGHPGTFSTNTSVPNSPRSSRDILAPSPQTPVCRTRQDRRGTSWHLLHKHQCAELAKIIEGHPGTFSTNTCVPNSPRSSRDILAPSPQTPVCRTRQDRRGTSWHLLHKHQCAELAKIVEGHPGTFSTNTSVPNSPRSSRDILAPSPQTPVCRTRQDHRGTSWHLLHKHLCAELAKIVRDILSPSPQTPVCRTRQDHRGTSWLALDPQDSYCKYVQYLLASPHCSRRPPKIIWILYILL